ncbi:copper homeostasis protein CutC [Arcanobacterium ihumii]|uniref:copper homeostasis protein CutC n=1 Tax=Arcanobacterium ihumii TaxID=2138162 RepID=UPI0013573225|nr:copper homeostasis protein CutC [Arcanobacterium ihumii]
MLEVICLNSVDATAAQEGGANRIELVGTMDCGGLSPDIQAASSVIAAVDIPVRIMVRVSDGFEIQDPSEVERLADLVREYTQLGTDGLVLGFLRNRKLDMKTLKEIFEKSQLEMPRFTFHRAIDSADNYFDAWQQLEESELEPDAVLTAGSSHGVLAGFNNLLALPKENAWAAERTLIGGGLSLDLIPQLRESGFRDFHVGSKVRADGTFNSPVDPVIVSRWAELANQ